MKTVAPIDACRFANIDPNRLNEAIAAGLYHHAPPTRRGSRRLFGARDLIPLRIFAQLCRFGFTRERAGNLVGEILKTGRVFDESKAILLQFNIDKIEKDAARYDARLTVVEQSEETARRDEARP